MNINVGANAGDKKGGCARVCIENSHQQEQRYEACGWAGYSSSARENKLMPIAETRQGGLRLRETAC